jgi:Miro-like protein.
MGTTESSLQEHTNANQGDHGRRTVSKEEEEEEEKDNQSMRSNPTSQDTARTQNIVHSHLKRNDTVESPERKHVVKVLKGVVCGHDKVGKSSLLYRLRGEEDIVHAPPKRHKQRMMALIPWKMEASPSVCNHDRSSNHTRYSTSAIQLHIVERHQDSYASMVETGQVDFIIFLVDRTRKETLDFVIEYLNGMKELKQKECECELPSLCLLLNHYDAWVSFDHAEKGDGGKKVTERNEKQSESTPALLDLEEAQMLMKEQFHEYFPVLCFDSCMINGYGLEALNYFMTISYLQTIERDLLLQMKQVRNDLNVWTSSFTSDKFTSFQDIQDKKRINDCKNQQTQIDDCTPQKKKDAVTTALDQEKVVMDDNHDDSGCSKEDELKKQKSSRRKVMFKSGTKPGRFVEQFPQNDESKQQSINTRRSNRRDHDETTLESHNKVVPTTGRSHVSSQRRSGKVRSSNDAHKGRGKRSSPSVDPKMALEAFLASDDDDDDDDDSDIDGNHSNDAPQNFTSVSLRRGIRRNTAVLYSDSEDDTSHDSD